jgi:hypothetical protein
MPPSRKRRSNAANYLVNSIMACGNCHSPRDAEGKLIADRALSGGLAFNTPPFVATAPNITPDTDTGIGSWSDAEIRRFKGGLGGGGRVFPPREGTPEGHAGNGRTQHHRACDRGPRRLERCRNHPCHHPWRGARRPAAETADGVWLLCRTQEFRSDRYRRLSQDRSAVAIEELNKKQAGQIGARANPEVRVGYPEHIPY